MVEKRDPIQVKEAVSRVMKYSKTGELEHVSLENAEGRYLAEDIIADHPVPPFDRSPLDGFAVQSKDTKGASSSNPVRLEVVETVGAGHVSTSVLKPGQAVRVMTGTIMPEACDSIIMFELAKEVNENNQTYIEITRSFEKNDFVAKEGEETKKGEVIVNAGKKITAGVIAVLATFGYAKVPVAKKPVIGIYATGTELLDVDQDLEPGKIRNSNAYMIISQVKQAGGEPLYFGKLEDNFELCFKAVQEALKEVDVLITTGGVSVGDFDFLPAIYKKLGANLLFNKIAMRPGSVTSVAEKDGQLLFGLSGNPSACYVGFELFTRPWIQTYLFSTKPYLESVKGTLKANFPKANPFTRFIRSKIAFEHGKVVAQPIGMDKSQVVTSLAYSDVFVALPGGTRGYKSGDEVDIILLNSEGDSAPFQDPVKSRKTDQ
ncbi:molybdopterin molybdenumtransferase [Salipaludibacillus neizhouensis]|uniref:Molybdopterin molybdenumtransferase n=1 Tax=Salipaludibacillus neizhouensis TaxID=885475 RepID=A0A3A9KDN0_9BACI|nr:gephyrin-like molybdotransferase Glp [Salipaludibacillus neizhouensis]RKL67753.1 molybdopterin molybdenumtransferase [Salipaludibacillus neizhouensis]